ncbi:MAG TPA: DUF5671 domain-containing protein [Anaerolineales bacterium]|nr:DUF5671 domain-containing protein [Anaerolineales bacterium]
MKSVRRLYFYLVAFISIEIVVWGLIGLLRSVGHRTISGEADALAQALALILVGVPIFLIHWLWAQRASAQEEEEKSASLRAVFFYAILLATLVPVVQNILSFIDRSLVQLTGLGVERAFGTFRNQTLFDNIVAILMNGVIAAYFWNVLRGEWKVLTQRENFSEIRRLYRYLWMLYGLLMTVFGAQQILRFLFYIPGNVLGELGPEIAVNGLALLIVGVPVWVYSWRIIQDSLSDPAEMGSTLRMGILYVLALGSVITVITTASMVVNIVVTRLLGANWTFQQFIQQVGGPLSVGVPLGTVWAYYGYWLNRHIEAIGDEIRQAAMKRLYYYVLSFIGLAVSFVGIATLNNFIIDIATGADLLITDAMRNALATSISSLVVGLPLWLTTWRRMQHEAWRQDEMGDHARRSLIRKTYLYLALFASVIGGMGTAVGLVYQLLRAALTGETGSGFISTLLNLLQLLFLFAVVLIYHLNILRRDGESVSEVLAAKQSMFSVLVVDSGEGLGEAVKAALKKLDVRIRVTVTSSAEKPQGDFNALVLTGSLAVDAPEWIRSFNGSRLIVRNEAKGVVWVDDAAQVAASLRELAEGRVVRLQKPGRSVWMYVVYVFAALFALQFLSGLLMLSIALVVGF